MPARSAWPVALSAAALLAASAAPARGAEAIHGVTADQQLVTFHSDSPAAMRSATPITGLTPGDRVVAIDLRPGTGELYALAASSRLYVVDRVSGAATAVGGAFAPLLAGTSFGLDFDPAADRLRVISDGRQNLRLHPEDGQVAGHDTPLAYAAGDEGEGANPGTGAAAFTRPAEGQPELMLIDTSRDVLATAPAPSQGALTTVGPLRVDLQEPTSFDIAADGRAWVVGHRPGSPARLHSADLDGGRLSKAARRAGLGADVVAITTAGPVPDDTRRPSVLLAASSAQPLAALRKPLTVAVSCSEACWLKATVKAGDQVLARGRGRLSEAGRTSVRATPTAAGRRLSRSGRPVEATVAVAGVDAAGNRSRSARSVRFG